MRFRCKKKKKHIEFEISLNIPKRKGNRGMFQKSKETRYTGSQLQLFKRKSFLQKD